MLGYIIGLKFHWNLWKSADTDRVPNPTEEQRFCCCDRAPAPPIIRSRTRSSWNASIRPHPLPFTCTNSFSCIPPLSLLWSLFTRFQHPTLSIFWPLVPLFMLLLFCLTILQNCARHILVKNQTSLYLSPSLFLGWFEIKIQDDVGNSISI